MGTNYYLPKKCAAPCEHCCESTEHVGKNSAGWTFGFQAYPDEGLTSWAAWKERIRAEGGVVNEYGEKFTPEEFEKLVERTREPWGPRGITPRHRDGISPILGEVDDRYFRDPEGWDFWEGGFS